MEQNESVNFRYKDTVFRMLFSNKENLLSLYNAISSKRCDTSEELKIVTLEKAIYMEVKNDTAFLLGDDIHLYEHQSTLNPNMPLRFLQYITTEYQRLADKKSLYSRKLIKLPRPHFVVFYNGVEDMADRETLCLSDAFEGSDEDTSLELICNVYNINAGHNKAMLEACETLKGYADFVSRIREKQKIMPLKEAVAKAVDECIKEGILEEFLRANRREVIGMSIFEFDREEHEKIIRTEEYAEGEAKGEYNKAISTAKNLLNMGLLSLEQIAQATQLPMSEIAAL